MKALLLSGLLVLLPGQGPAPKRLPVYVDAKFSASDKLSIIDAVARWNTTLDGRLVLDVVNVHARLAIDEIEDVREHHGMLLMQVGADCTFRPPGDPRPIGWADYVGGTQAWFVRPEIKDEWFETVVEHEIGHMLGATHQTHAPSVMYPYTDPRMQTHCLAQTSADEIADVRGVPGLRGSCPR